jgi:hypothetical protein
MKIALLIGAILILGGVSGLRRPGEWVYMPSGRLGSTTAQFRTIGVEGTRYLSYGAMGLGTAIIVGGAFTQTRKRK